MAATLIVEVRSSTLSPGPTAKAVSRARVAAARAPAPRRSRRSKVSRGSLIGVDLLGRIWFAWREMMSQRASGAEKKAGSGEDSPARSEAAKIISAVAQARDDRR